MNARTLLPHLATLLILGGGSVGRADTFQSRWQDTPDRMWTGPDYWANRLHDWRISDHRLICDSKGPRLAFHTLHLLSHTAGPDNQPLSIAITTGAFGSAREIGRTGFLVGVGEGAMDQRSAALVQMAAGPGGGFFTCIDSNGRLQIRDNHRPGRPVLGTSEETLPPSADIRLSLALSPDGENTVLTLAAIDRDSNKTITATASLPSARLAGNIALAREVGGKKPIPRWFSNWTISGARLAATPENTFGPIACTQYTLSRGVLKLTAQMLPLGEGEPRDIYLQADNGDGWKTIATTRILTPSFTAPFRIENWDDSTDTRYRVKWTDATWEGTIRRDPRDKPQLVVAGFTGNHNNAHGFGKPGYNYAERIYFPHADMMDKVAAHQPDLLFFSGDQHLATVAHHGIDEHGDANWSFCVPSICNFYPRAWAPELGPDDKYSFPAPESYTGNRRGSMGNLVTVHAASNPGRDIGHSPAELHNKMPGYGIVKLDRESRSITAECWPRFAVPGKDAQYPGWPVTIPMEANYGRTAKAWLPTLDVQGLTDPVVQVIDESNNEVIYTLRIRGTSFQPKTFGPGTYTVRIGDPDAAAMKTLAGLQATVQNDTRRSIVF